MACVSCVFYFDHTSRLKVVCTLKASRFYSTVNGQLNPVAVIKILIVKDAVLISKTLKNSVGA